jgi:predicted DNA-binding protein (UPF0251 family)
VARPPIERLVAGVPRVMLFKPAGVPARELEQSRLGIDELEAMRLVDGEGLSHEQAAERMGVSRQTVGRVLEVGRRKVVNALADGKAILIDGGQYRVGPQRWRCRECNAVFDAEYEVEEPACPACGSSNVSLCLGFGDGCGKGGRWRRGGEASDGHSADDRAGAGSESGPPGVRGRGAHVPAGGRGAGGGGRGAGAGRGAGGHGLSGGGRGPGGGRGGGRARGGTGAGR